MGRDRLTVCSFMPHFGFNPRARMGRDSMAAVVVSGRPQFQSTRPHGARLAKNKAGDTRTEFQSTRPHGARLGLAMAQLKEYEFQSTRPHGARLVGEMVYPDSFDVSIHAPAWGATFKMETNEMTIFGFNPRARMGRDHRRRRMIGKHRLFQSTRPHGARLVIFLLLLMLFQFQSTRPHGARQKTQRDEVKTH